MRQTVEILQKRTAKVRVKERLGRGGDEAEEESPGVPVTEVVATRIKKAE